MVADGWAVECEGDRGAAGRPNPNTPTPRHPNTSHPDTPTPSTYLFPHERLLKLVQEGELEAPTPGPLARSSKQPWPESVPQQILAVRERLATLATTATAEQLAAGFKGRREDRVFELLETLVVLGRATRSAEGYQLAVE